MGLFHTRDSYSVSGWVKCVLGSTSLIILSPLRRPSLKLLCALLHYTLERLFNVERVSLQGFYQLGKLHDLSHRISNHGITVNPPDNVSQLIIH